MGSITTPVWRTVNERIIPGATASLSPLPPQSIFEALLQALGASLAVALSLVICWKVAAKLTVHSWCSYFSLALPILGFVATRRSPIRVAAPPEAPQQSVDDLVKEIETEWRKRPLPPPPPVPAPALSPIKFLTAAVVNLSFSRIIPPGRRRR